MKNWKHLTVMAIIAIIALVFAFAACDDKTSPTEKPEYREDTINFVFKGASGNILDSTYKAAVQGTMLEADWNNAKITVKFKIENAQHNASDVLVRGDFAGVFGEFGGYDSTIIFTPNVSNGKLEVKDGEWNKLYINPTALDSITEAEIKTAVATMRNGIASPPLELENKTFPITLKDGALVFTVAYKALPADAEPAYLAYLQTRLGAMAVNTSNTNILAVDNLVAMGGNFTVRVVAGNEAGFTWNSTTREFEVQHDWISTATETDLSNLMMRNAFSSVQAE